MKCSEELQRKRTAPKEQLFSARHQVHVVSLDIPCGDVFLLKDRTTNLRAAIFCRCNSQCMYVYIYAGVCGGGGGVFVRS